jgi:hypothetical protein
MKAVVLIAAMALLYSCKNDAKPVNGTQPTANTVAKPH